MSTVNRLLDQRQRAVQPLFISSYPPRRCGIANYCRDLIEAMTPLNPFGPATIIAMEEGEERRDYPTEVIGTIAKQDAASYVQAAELINASSAEIVCLQHEFGLYGTDHPKRYYGEYVLPFMRAIDRPIVTTLHTILDKPSPTHRKIMEEIIQLSDIVITMLPSAKQLLEDGYGIHADRLVVVPHGVPLYAGPPMEKAKKQFGWEGRQVLLMTGLFGPGKGAEYVIKALPQIVKKFPDVLFVIVGQTHPELIKVEGESYRESLHRLAKRLKVSQHVEYVNEYVSIESLVEYYAACDIYLTPHLDPQQVSSGTLAYALGMGKPCISTKYVYAKEMLADDRGLLVDFRNSKQIGEAVNQLLGDPELRARISRNARALGKTMSWSNVAQRYLNLFRLVLDADDEARQELGG